MPRPLPTLVFAASAVLLAATACSTVGTLLTAKSVSFSQQQIQQKLSNQFPKDYKKLGGLVTLTLRNPRLTLPPGERRMHIAFDLGVGALGRSSGRSDGSFSLSSALRYDPATRALHLLDPRIEELQLAALDGSLGDTARSALDDWLADWARKEPVYRFDDSLIGRMGARRVEGTRIEDGQVVVELGT